jgi:hypothetical protein
MPLVHLEFCNLDEVSEYDLALVSPFTNPIFS